MRQILKSVTVLAAAALAVSCGNRGGKADVKPQEAETDGFKLATAEEIAELGRQGIFLHYDSIKQVFR